MLTLTIRTLIVRMTIGMMRIHGFDALTIKTFLLMSSCSS